jgi:hypothetical protein
MIQKLGDTLHGREKFAARMGKPLTCALTLRRLLKLKDLL